MVEAGKQHRNAGAKKVGEFLTEEEEALKIVRRETKKVEVGYEVGHPRKTGGPRLVNDKAMAESRLMSLLRKFEKDPDFEKDYDKAIKKYETEGYASRVQEDDEPAFYLPHHDVYKNTLGPKKLRVVLNAAALFRRNVARTRTFTTIYLADPRTRNDQKSDKCLSQLH